MYTIELTREETEILKKNLEFIIKFNKENYPAQGYMNVINDITKGILDKLPVFP